MTVTILSALLLAVLAYAVFQLTKKSEVEKEIEKLTQQDESYLLAELYSVNFTVWLCFAGGLLLTANYAITYFSGSEVRFISEWGFSQWAGALIGLVVGRFHYGPFKKFSTPPLRTTKRDYWSLA